MKTYCPKCQAPSTEVWLVYTSFQYCEYCKEDIQVLEQTHSKSLPTPQLSADDAYDAFYLRSD